MQKVISISLISVLLLSFLIFDFIRKSKHAVLKIITASEIIVDLNNNKRPDAEEYICIDNIDVLTSNLSKNQTKQEQELKIEPIDAIKFGFLSDSFADSILTDKSVKVKFTGKRNPQCRFADIIVNDNSYRETLLQSGYGFVNGKVGEKFTENLARAQNLDLVILNHKSNKYHKLDCEYGIAAGDAVIISKRQLPENSTPCSFCHVKHNKTKLQVTAKTVPPLISSVGNVKLYLTDLTTKLKPDRNCSSNVCQSVLKEIKSAKSSIDIALYGFDKIPEIYKALENAKNREVKIRIVHDKSDNNYYPETNEILKLADKVSSDSNKTLMHNKFIIIDNQTVITGSMNFSSTGFSGYNTNSLVIINSKDVAEIYEKEFSQMLSGKFGIFKNKLPNKTVVTGDTKITPLFSPKDKIITESIVPIIDNAKTYIYIPTFVITHKNLANALIKAKQRGVNVKVIIDATGFYSTGSKVKILRDNGIELKVENYAGKVHSKSIIIDDKYVITGSMNFSNSGENKNDENVLIIENGKLAKLYKEFFEYLWSKIPDKYLTRSIRAESKESIGSCSDGIDNNFDGKIDIEDEGCK